MRQIHLKFPNLDLNIGVPSNLRVTFNHLYSDIFWFGVLNGTVLTFINVYAARIGASASQIGYISAIPAIIAIVFALPAGAWLHKGDSNQKVVISSVLHRIFYALLILLPLISSQSLQINLILLVILIMSLPGTALQVGFNNLFAETVPLKWRGHVAGVRNALFAVISVVILLMAGQILHWVVFPINYQLVFGIGFIGAMLSSLYLWLVTRNHAKSCLAQNDISMERESDTAHEEPSTGTKSSWLITIPEYKTNRHFYKIMGILFFLNISIFLAAPVFPIFWVNKLGLSDSVISMGNGLFFATSFIGSTQISRLAATYGNRRIIGIGTMLMAFYPIILSISTGPPLFYVASLGGGMASALVGGLLLNYLLETIPEQSRSPFLAVYNIVLYAAILFGSLAGPFIGTLIGLPTAMILFALIRLLAGGVVLWKG
ncbi:MAG: hypothetical protein C0391_09955 [Anaerolinea sp.]|nr:hypothetical protein [Anaerolinea sp.]